MKLLLRRDQKRGFTGKVIFTLDVRAEISEEERGQIQKYKLGSTMLYQRSEVITPGTGLLGAASRLVDKMTNLTVSVDDLAGGKHIECKDIVEMVAVEEQIREACQTFRNVLDAAAHFGGEEVVEV